MLLVNSEGNFKRKSSNVFEKNITVFGKTYWGVVNFHLKADRYLKLQIKWPSYLLQTYNMDAQIGESSACATALMCGVKANFETVGLDARGSFENCFSSFNSRIPSLIDWAQESGKYEGVQAVANLNVMTFIRSLPFPLYVCQRPLFD